MKLNKLLKFAAQSACVWTACGTAFAVEPLLTNTTSFRIPFVVESETGGQVSGMAILFASVDNGPMEQVQKVDASAEGFQFNAPRDGLYSFAVRVTDSTGNVVGNSGQLTPELQVRVDTGSPEIGFQLVEAGGPGQVNVLWDCNDPQAAPGSFRMEYAEGRNGSWKQLSTSGGASGQTTIQSQPGTSISVRGFISDLAGNQGTGMRQIVLKAASSPPRETAPTPAAPFIPAPSSISGVSPFGSPGGPLAPPLGNNSSPVTNNAWNGGVSQASGPGSLATPQSSVQPHTAQINSNANNGHRTAEMQNGNSGFPGMTASSGMAIPSGMSRSSGMVGMPSMAGPTPGNSQIVNNRVFDITYQVEDVGPSGVSSVELFVTENNGREWFRYGSDIDLQSPFQVDTRAEGSFGFAVRVRNGLGFVEPPPQPGEIPSIVISVDQTPPIVDFSQPQVLADGQGRLRLQWRATDANPSATPVRLEYSVSAAGPWTPVFDWQMDQHFYEMPIQPGMPTALHFRLLARDAAGNVTTSQTNQPVLIDQHRPTARLLRVQPVSSTGRPY